MEWRRSVSRLRRRILGPSDGSKQKHRRQTKCVVLRSPSSIVAFLRQPRLRSADEIYYRRSVSRTSCSGTGILDWQPYSWRNILGISSMLLGKVPDRLDPLRPRKARPTSDSWRVDWDHARGLPSYPIG